MIRTLSLAGLAALIALPALAQGAGPVRLSEREKQARDCVRYRDGTVECRVGSGGLPWLFGLGDVYGKAGGLPTVNGRTDSILRSTPSAGLVPGQDPH